MDSIIKKLGVNRPVARRRKQSGIAGELCVTVINWHLDPNSSLWRDAVHRADDGICLEVSGVAHESRSS